MLAAENTLTGEQWQGLYESRHEWLQNPRPELDMQVGKTEAFSVMANPACTLMWSHYAASHTRIYLEYGIQQVGEDSSRSEVG